MEKDELSQVKAEFGFFKDSANSMEKAARKLLVKAQELSGINIERIGELFSFSGVQYLARDENSSFTFWSPPWADCEVGDTEKDILAFLYAVDGDTIESLLDANEASKEQAAK